MCRNIRTLYNFEPPVTEEEIRALSGFNKPSMANQAAFQGAVDEVTEVAARLLHSLETTAAPRNRGEEAAKARARNARRFGAGLNTTQTH